MTISLMANSESEARDKASLAISRIEQYHAYWASFGQRPSSPENVSYAFVAKKHICQTPITIDDLLSSYHIMYIPGPYADYKTMCKDLDAKVKTSTPLKLVGPTCNFVLVVTALNQ